MNVRVFPGRLFGRFELAGAKNSALKLLSASLLTDQDITLERYPSSILDAKIHVAMLQELGKQCIFKNQNETIIIKEVSPKYSLRDWSQRSIRNTLLILGCLTARFGTACVPLPGGCALGERKYDLHQMILEKMGAKVWAEDNYLFAEKKGSLNGADIHLPIRSTGATENAILCGCLAHGRTHIWNPHVRPELLDLISMLNSMGASIQVFGQQKIEIDGVESLGGAHHHIIPDNMEALTWVIGGAISGGEVEIIDFPFDALEVPLIFLRESGLKFYKGTHDLVVKGSHAYPLDISTGPFPGINSDMQPLMAVFGACANGETRIVDLRFPGRFGYAQELVKLGIQCEIKDNMLIINGSGAKFTGGIVRAVDLRAGAALLLAGLVSQESTLIQEAWQIERGYHLIWKKLENSGIKLQFE